MRFQSLAISRAYFIPPTLITFSMGKPQGVTAFITSVYWIIHALGQSTRTTLPGGS